MIRQTTQEMVLWLAVMLAGARCLPAQAPAGPGTAELREIHSDGQ